MRALRPARCVNVCRVPLIRNCETVFACGCDAECVGAAWAGGGRPVVAEFVAELAACGGPVVFDGFAEFEDVAFEVKLVFLEPGEVEFLTGSTALQLARDVLLVIAYDPVIVRRCEWILRRQPYLVIM